MLCTQCSAENPADARFCGKCGHTLKQSEPAPQTKSWLTGPVIFAGVVVILLCIAGIGTLLYIVGSQQQQQPFVPGADSPANQPAQTTQTLPVPEELPPATKVDSATKTASEPVNFNAVSDTLYRQRAVGTWRVRTPLNNGSFMDMQAVYAPNGTAAWSGTVTAQGQTYYIAMTGSWGIESGYFTVRIAASNMPQLIQSGYTSVNKIVNLTDDQWTYVDTITGGSETATRVR